MSLLEVEWKTCLLTAAILGGAVLLSLLAHSLIFFALKRGASKTGSIVDDSFVAHARRPAFVLLPLAAIVIVLPSLKLPADLLEGMRHIVALGLIGAAAWLAISLTAVFDGFISSEFMIDVSDNLLARRVHTRTRQIRRIAVIAILFGHGLEPALSYPREADLVPAGALPAELAEDSGGVPGKTAGVAGVAEVTASPGLRTETVFRRSKVERINMPYHSRAVSSSGEREWNK